MKAAAAITTPTAYLASLADERREIVKTLHEAIVKEAPSLKPRIVYGMLGYGAATADHGGGRAGDALVALASQKQHVSLYICVTGPDGKHLPEANAARLGKVSVGKGCIRFKRLADLDLPVVLELVRQAARLG